MSTEQVINKRYQVLSMVKEGGFGIIYKGYDSVLGKDIIAKKIRPELLSDPEIIEQFQSEARHVAKMNHQNIVHVFDLVQDEQNNYYMIMEYIDGMDLGTLIQNSQHLGQKIPRHLTLHIIAEVCKALDYAHNCRNSETNEPLNFVHQDISPGNIMISKTGIVKLIDFGLTGMQRKSIDDENYMVLRGKVPYMSPEHVNNDQVPDKRSDVFSLGLVLYEALEGKRFFHLEYPQKIIETLRNGKLRIRDFKNTPRHLRKIVRKALAKPQSERYQNANQFYIDLVTYLASSLDSTALDEELADFIKASLGENGLSKSTELLDTDPFETTLDNAETEFYGGGPHFDGVPDLLYSQPGNSFSEQPQPDLPSTAGGPHVGVKKEVDEQLFEGGDDVKTVIDVFRLSERGHKKTILRAALATAALVFIFLLSDIALQLTPLGTGIYDFIFPPAIKITSLPPGAKVYLNNRVQPGMTPLAIDKIQPGVYELKLTKENFDPIVKSLIIPRKGDIKVQGEQERRGGQAYTFRFKTRLQLNSVPPNAEVYINGIKYGLKTPCSVTWEIGEPCEIRMKKAGFEDLTGFALDTETMTEQIDDRRLWKIEVEKNPTTSYRIDGLFGKHFTISSKPENAAIYLNDIPNPVGKTGKRSKIFLTAASHKITLKKKKFNPRLIKLDVKEDTPEEIFATLTRPVKFVAYDATNGKDKDLQAVVSNLRRKGKKAIKGRRTPFKIDLEPASYTATFSRKGYKTVKVNISQRDEVVVARMEPLRGQFSVVVLDEDTNAPLNDVEVRFSSLDNPNDTTVLFEKTDGDGTCSGELTPGLYLLRTRKRGYAYQEQSFMIRSTELNLIEFNLKRVE
ncbi:MAG: protein kinase [bacterium]